eukprot:NODE_5209_length_724_cov_2.328889_g4163_i1.p5 GENE.NODE_5209_length_724_cov_2.328889_g4163_i1~~NODE_5209_length_724_cov_2.328889_g4163_i1.p5  ORF type:complete len:72 (-),score=0.24 NODE_5209_length_724_cov_2.328889_g4163_i1:191-406(-)
MRWVWILGQNRLRGDFGREKRCVLANAYFGPFWAGPKWPKMGVFAHGMRENGGTVLVFAKTAVFARRRKAD